VSDVDPGQAADGVLGDAAVLPPEPADGGPQATRRSWSPVVSMHHATKSAHQNCAPKPKYVE
jgi:hypothetical protein